MNFIQTQLQTLESKSKLNISVVISSRRLDYWFKGRSKRLFQFLQTQSNAPDLAIMVQAHQNNCCIIATPQTQTKLTASQWCHLFDSLASDLKTTHPENAVVESLKKLEALLNAPSG